MILINIDSLSTTELQYIAQQEGVESWEDLDREDLIDALEEAFGEQDDEHPQNNKGKLNRNRYCNSLTSYRGDAQAINGLPGTESLPDNYHDNSIHLLLRDPQWAYAYWSVSPQSLEASIDEEGEEIGNFFLRVSQRDLDSDETTSYDITIDRDDAQWNINLPDMGAAYLVDLCYRDGRGDERSLAQSKEVEVQRPHWHLTQSPLAEGMTDFCTHFSSLVTKEGEIVDNALLREVAGKLTGGLV